MSDDEPTFDLSEHPTPPAPANPHEAIEAVASGAIGRAVRVTERGDSHVSLLLPADTTMHGEVAVRRAVVAHLGEGLLVLVSLDDPPPET